MPTTLQRSPFVVAIASWLVPGMGYLLIGQRTRSLTVGVTIIVLFLGGLLIGGVRVLDVPGFNSYGQPIMAVNERTRESKAIMAVNPWQEIKAKPWSMAQIMAGPISIFGGGASILAAQPATTNGYNAIAEVSHTPVNEAGTLYTSVAGMLNLLAIIDAAYRASKRESGDQEEPDNRGPAQAANPNTAARRREVA